MEMPIPLFFQNVILAKHLQKRTVPKSSHPTGVEGSLVKLQEMEMKGRLSGVGLYFSKPTLVKVLKQFSFPYRPPTKGRGKE